MEISSKYFDRIRIGKRESAREKTGIACQWEGCDKSGTHRAPMGRQYEGQYLHFCFDHVREYNKSYNYFSGLSDEQIQRFHKDSLTGLRPTWTMGVNRWGARNVQEGAWRDHGPMRFGSRVRPEHETSAGSRRTLRTLEKKALDDLGLAHGATSEQIRTRYKELVKRHHPDANGGDRSLEERLRQIIHAYKYLRQAGFC